MYLNNDICIFGNPLLTTSNTCDVLFLGTMKYGFKAVVIRYFELLRYLGVEFLNVQIYDFLNSPEFYEISK